MEVNKFQILLINVTFLSLTGLKAYVLIKNVKNGIWTAPAVKGLMFLYKIV